MDDAKSFDPETTRLAEDAARTKNWKRWGPYLSERQWGTVREDYSSDGNCWSYLPHDMARSRAYRWGEDGIMGICDRECRLCFALAMWNGKDPILKERLFGLTGPEGNHGEDVKEYYYYLDSTPTHSYLKGLYKYPQAEYPYAKLVEENARRTRLDPEYELIDTGIFDADRYFDVVAEYAKAGPDDICIKLTVINRGPEAASLHFLPTLWYRNAWTWGCAHEGCSPKPWLARSSASSIKLEHTSLGNWRFEIAPVPGVDAPELLFTDNETNNQRCFQCDNHGAKYVKDAFHDYVVGQRADAVNPQAFGTKAAAYYKLDVPAGGQITLRFRLFADDGSVTTPFGTSFEQMFADRVREADQFYDRHIALALSDEQRRVARQAYAGMFWSKQFYHYVVQDWLNGDPGEPAPPPERKNGRNRDWGHLFSRDVLSMPDKWEYPWFASWDLAFHMITFAPLDPQLAKEQLLLLLREWYMHPSGKIPAYEFEFSDVNPPVHAWACWRVYKMTGQRGSRDRLFLERAFQKLLINFTWWVNRKDVDGKNLFAGGFLGLDNIGIFDRSRPLPTGGSLQQADGTAWMAFFCNTMLAMALELASEDPAYEDIASKFFEHFVAITDAMNTLGGTGLWDDTDGFYYDQLLLNNTAIPLRVRSMVGIIPLFACEILERPVIDKLPGFSKRMNWFLRHRQDLAKNIAYMEADGDAGHSHYLLAIPSRERLEKVLRYVLDESEFLSPVGIRSISRFHKDHPYVFRTDGATYDVHYVPGESDTGLFGGNSNWRGPVWFPLNFLLVEALERYHHFYGNDLRFEYPTGSGQLRTLTEIARDLATRLTKPFLPDETGHRPFNGTEKRFDGPHFKDLILFHEYFDGDTGRGVGASHQTGWTGLVGRILLGKGRFLLKHEHDGETTSAR